MYTKIGMTIATSLILAGCGGGTTKVVRNTDLAFPHAFELTTLNAASSGTALASGGRLGAGAEVASRIDQLLDGSLPLKNVFTPELVYQHGHDAQCYGPNLRYADHPDGNGSASGELPGGDLGIWTVNERNTTEACTAAQLNARMTGIKKRTMSSLFMLASSLDAMYDAGHTLPSVGAGALDVTADMPGVPGVMFDLVTIEQTASAVYHYVIGFDYNRSGRSYGVTFEVTHRASTSKEKYLGRIKYEIEDTIHGGNCGAGENDITKKGSIVYARTSADDFEVDAREADFCGHGTSNGFDSEGLLDPSDRYDPAANPDGWGNNYARFMANYQKSDLAGLYSYVWQAGPMDSHSRVLQMDLTEGDKQGGAMGETYFGYGPQVFDTHRTQGEILGMICNWAGPGHTHIPPQNYAQRQRIRFNKAKGFFETSAVDSDITYAPTNSCQYDGGGTFDYDRELNGVLGDGDIVIVKTGAGAGELDFDLSSTWGTMLPTAPVWP